MNNLYKELRISSSLSNLFKVGNFVEEICDAYYITSSYFGNILLSLEEAVKNAIIHGNGEDPDQDVRVTFQRIPNGLKFTVTDEGPGFDFRAVPDPVESGNGESGTGTGMFLIRSLADQISYNSKGNQVEIVFYITSINQETTLTRISQLNQYFMKQKTAVK